MASLNQAQLIGNLGKDPEIRSLNSGDRVANFSVATSETWRDKSTGEKREKTEWHNVVVFGALVDVIEKYVKKGDKVFIQGKLQTRKYQDKDGNDRYTTEIVLTGFNGQLVMLGSRGARDESGGSASGGGSQAKQKPAESFELNDEIPF